MDGGKGGSNNHGDHIKYRNALLGLAIHSGYLKFVAVLGVGEGLLECE